MLYSIQKFKSMPNIGDNFTITLGEAHLKWGTHRYTSSRTKRKGEGYLPIPREYAVAMNITMSNHPANNTYSCSSADGILQNAIVKAQGNSKKGDIYAKQFAGKKKLRMLGNWFTQTGAVVGDKIKIEFTSPTSILVTKL